MPVATRSDYRRLRPLFQVGDYGFEEVAKLLETLFD